MNLHRRLGIFLALSLVALSCSETSDPISGIHDVTEASKAAGGTIVSSTSVVLNGYEVVYDGRTYDGSADQTTFAYTVRASGATSDLSNFVLQLPDCAPSPDASSPAGGEVGTDPNTGLFGIKWSLSLSSSDTVGRSYSVTYPGDIPEGVVRVAVKAATDAEFTTILGACGGFDVAGTVFVDQDGDGVRRDLVDEPGVVADVTVTLVNPDGSIETQKTDALGQYLFRRDDGTYTLRIDLETTDDDFNDELGASFVATTPLTFSVTVGPDALDNDFGFDPQTQKIKDDLNTGALFTNGENAKFWAAELRAASKGRTNTTYDAATMLDFLTQIEALFFDVPYQFTDGSEFEDALAILTNQSNEALDILLKELLTTQLNHVAGLGLANDLDFQAVLISWGESWVRERLGTSIASGTVVLGKPIKDDPDLTDVTEVFGAINDQRGGGDAPDPGTGG